MRQSIRGYIDGLIQQASSDTSIVTTTAGELAAVRDLIDGSADLRAILIDPGVPAASRRAVVDQLLANRVGETTLRALTFLIDADRATEFAENLAWLISRFEAASDDLHAVSDVILGQKAAEERADGYATALLDEGSDDAVLGRVEDELFYFLQVIGSNDDLHAALTDRDLPADVRRKVVTDLLDGKAEPVTLALAAYATQVGRPRDYETLIGYLIDRAAKATNRRLAEVRSAVSIDDDQLQQLAQALSSVVGHDVQIRVTVDPSLLAGFVATIGDIVVDGSARHRLELLKERLVTPEVRVSTGESN